MSVLVFDIETVPDLVGLRQLRGTAPDIGDDALWAAIQAERAAEGKSDFMPHHLQRVLVVSCVFRSARTPSTVPAPAANASKAPFGRRWTAGEPAPSGESPAAPGRIAVTSDARKPRSAQ